MKKGITLVAALCLALTVFDGVRARTLQQPQRDDEVRIVPNGQRAGAEPGQKGATYYALEGQATEVTTVFADGMIASAERSFDGGIVATLRDGNGSEVNRVRVERTDGLNDVVQYLRPSEEPLQALIEPGRRPTLDWSNRQSHLLHRDGVVSSAGLRWKDGVMRPDRSTPEGDELATVRSVDTLWPGGLRAKTRRVPSKTGDMFDGKPVRGDVLVTTLSRDGVDIGVANYFTFERIFAWKIPGVTEGVIANEHLQARYGGWLFRPDMTWMNLQTLGMYRWKIAIDQKRFVGLVPQPGLASRIAEFFAPVVHANEQGCDDLHWLDGTTFRFCCDLHDLCYEKYGCNSSTWWQVWSSWSCDRCNMDVVWCFAGGGTGHGPLMM
jgi:hypothetical protein